jgi:tRNA pseudouridine synthase 10
MAEASASAEAEARSILERAAESSFPPLHAVHHLLSVEVRLSYLLMCCPVELLSVH